GATWGAWVVSPRVPAARSQACVSWPSCGSRRLELFDPQWCYATGRLALPPSQHVRVMALAPSLRFPFSRAFFALTPPPSRRALGLALLTLDALAFCWRGIEMRPHGINDGMKIDIRVDKSRQVLEL